uniref:Tetratricopeptide (TPR) repeat n=1 Tax=Candidatus Kentrum sp. TUN TaxID=2126343 RepID=A0A450ZMZ5_9GAMM|nr:MAG: Tetratricopeptide (TPR) repeat [Candidatus Kentron sp. TUN]VFK55146.1 MAG: Tetratricopeptide (TPR) repeat [Candidatus Kentron sp. TUN]
MNDKTVFLSYRRDTTGKAFARSIERELTHHGYDVFLDVDTMESGPWPDQIERAIPACAHFLLLLTPGALDKCDDQNDWVRREYELAARYQRNIVPVREESFDTDHERAHCPESMGGVFPLQIATVSHGRFKNDITELTGHYIPPHKAPKQPESSAASPRQPPRTLHNLPPRNPHFTGRAELLSALRRELEDKGMAELQGMGGIGKTQTALKYAHGHAHAYGFIGWLRAEDPEDLAEAFAGLAGLLALDTKTIADRNLVIDMVRRRLETQDRGLLIFDNVEDRDTIAPYSPQWGGHTLITTRNPALGMVRAPLPTETFTLEETRELLERHLDPEPPQALQDIHAELGGLPLALEQARAYMQESGRNITSYLELFRTHRAELLAHVASGAQTNVTVATTWQMAFERVAEEIPESAALLNLCAFLAPENIPYHLFTRGAEHLPRDLTRVADDLAFDGLITALLRHALLESNGTEFSFHRLVQAILYARLPEAERPHWLAQAIRLLEAAFPFLEADLDTWTPSAALMAHVNAVRMAAGKHAVINDELGRLLNRAGSYLRVRAEYPHSRMLLETSLEIRQQLHGEQHADTAESLNDMALLLDSQGQYREAKPLFERALRIRQSILGEEHPDTAASLNNLAELLRSQSQYQEAEPLYEQALRIRQSVFGEAHPDTAASLNNLALLLNSQGQHQEAKPLFERALRIHQSVLGEAHPNTASSLDNLAYLLKSQDQYQEAKPLYEQALRIYQSVFGKEHPHTATSLNNLAALLQSQGQYQEAKPLFEQALRIYQSVFGEKHPDTAISLYNLGMLLFKQRKKRAAIPYLERALVAHEAVFQDQHPNTLRLLVNLGAAYAATGKPLKARECLTRAREIKEKHPEYQWPSIDRIDEQLKKVSHGEGKRGKTRKPKKTRWPGKGKKRS